MINHVFIAQVVGTLALYLLFGIKFWLVVNPNSSNYVFRRAVLWFLIWLFAYNVLRSLTLFHIGTTDQRTIAAGWSAVVPLVGTLVHMYLDRKMKKEL